MGQNPSDHMWLHGFCSISILGRHFWQTGAEEIFLGHMKG